MGRGEGKSGGGLGGAAPRKNWNFIVLFRKESKKEIFIKVGTQVPSKIYISVKVPFLNAPRWNFHFLHATFSFFSTLSSPKLHLKILKIQNIFSYWYILEGLTLYTRKKHWSCACQSLRRPLPCTAGSSLAGDPNAGFVECEEWWWGLENVKTRHFHYLWGGGGPQRGSAVRSPPPTVSWACIHITYWDNSSGNYFFFYSFLRFRCQHNLRWVRMHGILYKNTLAFWTRSAISSHSASHFFCVSGGIADAERVLDFGRPYLVERCVRHFFPQLFLQKLLKSYTNGSNFYMRCRPMESWSNISM